MTTKEVKIQKAMETKDKIRKEKKALWFKANDILGTEQVSKSDKVFKYMMVTVPDAKGTRRVAFVTDNGKAVYRLTKGGRLFATKDYLVDYLDFHTEMYQEIIDWYNDTLLPAIEFLKQVREENKKEKEEKLNEVELEESDVDVEKEDYVDKLAGRFVKFKGLGEKKSRKLAKYVAENKPKINSVADLEDAKGFGKKTLAPLENVNVKNLIA